MSDGLNHYEVLGVEKEASSDEIKATYRKIVLVEHPDKLNAQSGETGEGSQDRFIAIQKAFNILRDPQLREEYNQELLNLERKSAVVINAELDLDEFDVVNPDVVNCDVADDEVEDDVYFRLLCRCGGFYWTSESRLADGKDVVPCDGCSLYVRVLFDVEEEE